MLKELLAAETCLFGDTSRRSRVTLLPPVLTPPRGKQIPYTLRIPDQNSGLRYLGYGLFERHPPECIPEGTQVTLSCLLRSAHRDDADLRALCATLWAWATLGGIGGRARRGYGSLQISGFVAMNHAEVLKPWNDLVRLRATPDAYLTAFGDGIVHAQDALTALLRAEKLGARQLSNDAEGPHEAIRSLDGIAEARGLRHTYSSGLEALEHAGALFRDFRSTLRRRDLGRKPLPDYRSVKASLAHPFDPPERVDRAAFGLPLRFFYRSLGDISTWFSPRPPHVRREEKSPDRLASPLVFRVYKLAGDKYGVALINLAGKATAPPLQGCELAQKRPNSPRCIAPPPPAGIIKDFLDWAIKEPPPQTSTPRTPTPRRRR